MTISAGSGQSNGAPLLITATAVGAAQTVHTAPAGAATPNLVDLYASNISDVGVNLFVGLFDSLGTLIQTFSKIIGARSFNNPVLDDGQVDAELILNGTISIRVWAATASVLLVGARVDNQSATSGTLVQNIASGLIAAVQNASRFAVGAMGGTGQATRANGEIMIDRAGILRNLRAKVDSAVGGGATLTVSIFINGVVSGLLVTIANAQGTNLQSDTDSVAVAVGDLVTFSVACDNAGAPAANVQAAVEYVAQ